MMKIGELWMQAIINQVSHSYLYACASLIFALNNDAQAFKFASDFVAPTLKDLVPTYYRTT